MRTLLLSVSFLFCTMFLHAQTDPFAALDSGMKSEPEYATATFKGTRLINFQTVETPGKNTLDFRISHRFGDYSTGLNNLYGLDGPANLWLGLDYSPDGRLVVSVGRVNIEKLITSGLKYKLFRQSLHGWKSPFTVTLLADWNITTIPAASATYTDEFHYTTDRFNFTYQAMIARKFNERFSLQISPTMIHYNEVIAISDKNDIYALPVLARYKFSRSVAVTAEYGFRINKYSPTNTYQNVAGIGFDIETGGHVFQVFVTNAVGIAESQTLPFTTQSWSKQQFRLGFNISRMFSF